MNPASPRQEDSLKRLCNRIILEHPEAICMALIELDCGCIHVCGVSVTGIPVGRMETFSGLFDKNSDQSPVCIRCAGAAGGSMMDRIIHRALIWPGDEHEKPDKDLRNLIGRAVFGRDYQEPEI